MRRCPGLALLVAVLIAGCGVAPTSPAGPPPVAATPAPVERAASSLPVTPAPTSLRPSAVPPESVQPSPTPTARPATESITAAPLPTLAVTSTPVSPSVQVAADGQGVQVVGHLGGLPGPVAAVQTGYVTLGIGPEFAILRLGAPAGPERVAYVLLPGAVQAIAPADDYALVAARSAGLWVLDLSDPTTPRIAGSFEAPGEYTMAQDVTVQGSLAYLAEDEGLRVLDISDAGRPAEIAFLDTPGVAQAVAVAGGLVLAGERSCSSAPHQSPACRGSLFTVDVSSPDAPALLGQIDIDTYDGIVGLTIDGHTVYAAGGTGGLFIVDISDPAAPLVIGRVPGDVRDVAIVDGIAYLAGRDGLHLVDVSYPGAAASLGSVSLEGGAAGVAVQGSHAYLSNRGLARVDVTDPARPAVTGTYNAPVVVDRIATDSQRAYTIGASGRRVSIIDLSDPARPLQVGAYDTPRPTTAIAAHGRYAYVADGDCAADPCDGQVWVIDVQDGAQPRLVGSYDPPGFALGLAWVSANRLYVADRDQGLRIVDISTPAQPRETTFYDTPGFAMQVSVEAGSPAAYVADRGGGAQVIVPHPAGPTLESVYAAPDEVWSVAPAMPYLYVATRSFGLHIVDQLEEPSAVLVGTYLPPNYASSYDIEVATALNQAYLAAGAAGLRVLDVSDVQAPREIGYFDTPGNAEDVALAGEGPGDLILIADGLSGLFVLRVTQR